MEKQVRSFYYIGLEEQNSKKAEKKEKCQKRREKNLLPIYRCGKKLFFGKEEIVLYYSLLPADFLKEIRKKRKKSSGRKEFHKLLLMRRRRFSVGAMKFFSEKKW